MVIGYIILAITILAAVGGILFKHFSWERNAPKKSYRGTRYEFLEGCIEWTDMENAIDCMFEGISQSDKVMKDIWIRVYPYSSPIKTIKAPTGYIGENGFSAMPPTDEASAQKTYILNGLTEFEKKWPIGASTAMVHVRQHRPSDGKLDARLLRGTGPIVADTARSALFHEVAEHVNPSRKGEGVNASHTRKDLIEISRALTIACLNKNQQK